MQAAIWMNIGRSYHIDRRQNPVWIDTLIERNYITRCGRGVEMRQIASGTLVRDNTLFDVDLPYIDDGTDNDVVENRIEMPVLQDPPPAAELGRQ